MGNLLANAVEHGGGVVEVSWRVGATEVTIEVLDEGPGLPGPLSELACRRPRPWPAQRLRRAGRRRHRAGSRRGHGLAVASAIAFAHGGTLDAAPSERGARLVLVLPSAGA
jgi:signal transduction histidine kinase